jgi:hypothetical protein
MKSNCNYDKLKLLHEVSHMIWRIRKHYIRDAKKENHPLCAKMYKEIADGLEEYKEKLAAAVGGLAKEGKLH